MSKRKIVDEHALIERINRKIADQCVKLHKAHPDDNEELGQYYEVDLVSPNVDSDGNLKARWSTFGVSGLQIDLERYGHSLARRTDGSRVRAWIPRKGARDRPRAREDLEAQEMTSHVESQERRMKGSSHAT